jgi:hypothetical protein
MAKTCTAHGKNGEGIRNVRLEICKEDTYRLGELSINLNIIIQVLGRDREEEAGGGVVRDTTVWGVRIETKFAVLKVPRQCPLVLLVWVRLFWRIR